MFVWVRGDKTAYTIYACLCGLWVVRGYKPCEWVRGDKRLNHFIRAGLDHFL